MASPGLIQRTTLAKIKKREALRNKGILQKRRYFRERVRLPFAFARAHEIAFPPRVAFARSSINIGVLRCNFGAPVVLTLVLPPSS